MRGASPFLPLLTMTEDVRRAIMRLTSAHDGDLGVGDVVACGRKAIPAVRAVLFRREPSGLYETRRRAVEALARLHAHDDLLAFLEAGTARGIADPVEETGEAAVVNAVARALADAGDARAVPVLLDLARERALAGVIEALGRFGRREAIPYLVAALDEDFARPAAEDALRRIGPAAGEALRATATLRQPPGERESVSSLRRRRSALRLVGALGLPPGAPWPALDALMLDEDAEIAATACALVLARGGGDARRAVARLVALIPAADLLLREEIEDRLAEHFALARPVIDDVLARHGDAAGEATPTVRSLRRVAARALARRRSP
jgi:HEAT repeats